jgi:hypothetical protein
MARIIIFFVIGIILFLVILFVMAISRIITTLSANKNTGVKKDNTRSKDKPQINRSDVKDVDYEDIN